MPADASHVVIDANVAAAWFLERPWSAAAALYRDADVRLSAPDLVVHEIGNVLAMNVRSGAIDVDMAAEVYEAVLPFIVLTPGDVLHQEALDLAVRLGHSIYDSIYLALAARHGIPIVTADGKLARRARRVGVDVVFLDR